MGKPVKPLKLKRSRALVPAPTGGDLSAETANINHSLSNDPRVEEFSIVTNKTTGVIKVRAVGYSGQTVVQEMLGPGLVASTTSHPEGETPAERREARDANIIALHLKNLSQDEIAERLSCSQSLVSKVLKRKGYR